MSYSHSFKTILYSLRFIILSTIIFFRLNRLYHALYQSYRLLIKLYNICRSAFQREIPSIRVAVYFLLF